MNRGDETDLMILVEDFPRRFFSAGHLRQPLKVREQESGAHRLQCGGGRIPAKSLSPERVVLRSSSAQPAAQLSPPPSGASVGTDVVRNSPGGWLLAIRVPVGSIATVVMYVGFSPAVPGRNAEFAVEILPLRVRNRLWRANLV
jgi:hypothetical protein